MELIVRLSMDPGFWRGYRSSVGTILLGMWSRSAQSGTGGWGDCRSLAFLPVLVPSGLWMAWYAMTGAVAGAGLRLLAIGTAVCTTIGWRAAVGRRFDEHRRWMLRTYVLLSSAVVIDAWVAWRRRYNLTQSGFIRCRCG